MRSENLPQILIALLVIATVAVGLIVVGGPEAGRMEKRDESRIADLRKLGTFVQCVADLNQNTLPEVLGQNTECNKDIRLADPFTDTPYQYEKVSQTTYRLCAEMEVPDRTYYIARFEPSTGCLTLSYPR